ncbi:Uncharacterized protein TPAR_01884 [Tolypocladium paradoxum]|uniref:PHD-type domain-containing protein n=1 Tax=Tolypocladium paradoxum TaxID=94208 RepID=A0A2S4L637_9HYPO|nr:Uncharacterized protein TPAR_01884 [Tolypocladium paradoxum]
MISSNTRASRSSRYSSPAQPHAGSGSWNGPLEVSRSSANEGSRALMARWLEPSVQAKPSFEEAGLARYGVLETMAPLGAMPKPKKPAGENGSTVRKIILRPSGANSAGTANANAAREAAEPKSQPKSAPTSPPPPSPVQPAPARRKSLSIKVDDVEDDEYDPNGSTRRRRSKRVSLPAKKARHAVMGERSDSVIMARTAATPKPSIPRKRPPRPDSEDKEFTDKVVEAAVDEALKHYRYPTAWALRTLYDEKCDDAEFVAMIEDIFKQTADAETVEEFSRLMEDKKREGKRDDQGCYYFVPPTTNSRFTPHKPKPAPYAELLRDAEGVAQAASGTRRAARKAKTVQASPRKTTASGVVVKARTPRSSRSKRHAHTHTHARRDSGSSMSSLSSAMSLSLSSPEAEASANNSPSLRGAPGGAAATKSHHHADAAKSQPITTRGKSLASSKHAVSNTSEPNSPPNPHHHHRHSSGRTRAPRHSSTADDASMPGRLAASELFPNLAPRTAARSAKTGVKAPMPDDEDDPFWDRRRDARKVTNGYSAHESSVRDADEEPVETPIRKTRKTRQSLVAPVSTRATRSASKRPIDEVERTDSPAAFSWQGDGDSMFGSRAATPTALRPTKKPRTGLRVKSSPVKKKGGTAAGVPRSMGEANLTLNNGAPKDPTSDNDEYCSACGNAGDVVCCDGCPRSFHFECVDMVQSEDLPDEWYCNECLIRRFPSRVPVHKGIFASALNNLEKSIPRAFSLPKKVQNRFEGVKAGADGDYEDVTVNKTAKKRNGYDELPDFFKQREDGQAVLCHACQKSATEIRAIIPCSVCPFYWHIDCLDPPLAVPPVLKTWRCPAHVDDVLIEVPSLAPAHRFRKVKGSQAITPVVSRGLKNNGHIEIDWNDEPEEADDSGWPDPQSFGRTFKLSAKGVVLDFIEQLRHQGAGYGSRQNESKRVPYPSPPTQRNSATPLPGSALERTVEEMQVSLNLIGLRQKRSEGIDQLTSALLSAADQNVLSLMAKGNANNIASGQLTQDDKQSLRTTLAQMEAMSARIREVLSDEKPSPETPAMTADAHTPVSEPSGINESSEKLESIAPVTEPTPPSTVDHAEGSMDLD